MKADIKPYETGYIARLLDNNGNPITQYRYFLSIEEAEQYLSEIYLDFYNNGI